VLVATNPESVNLKELPPVQKSLENKKWAIVDELTFRGQPTADFTVRQEEDPRLSASPEKGNKDMRTTVCELAEVMGYRRLLFYFS
jgi:hypothetical protein